MPVLANTSTSNGPTPRPQGPNGARPRPMSMPLGPQSYTPATPADSVVNTGTSTQTSAVPAPAATNGAGSSNSRNQKPRSSNRVLGDYIIGKTLGQGSMGKVKLAYHNITGEKVRRVAFLCSLGTHPEGFFPFYFQLHSLPSRFFLVPALMLRRQTNRLRRQPSKLRRMHRRKFVPFEKQRCPCFCTIPTSVA